MREPKLKTVAVADLRPTQITVGYREVAAKRRLWRERSDDKADDYLGSHMMPVLLGPRGQSYVIDHHHLARALLDEGVEEVATTTVADLSHLTKDEFWVFVDNRACCHPYDAEGVRRPFSDIPKTVAGLKDDPYRSLARRAAPGWRLRQGHHPVQRIPVGRLPAPPGQGKAGRGRLRKRPGQGAETVEDHQRGPAPARLVRAVHGRVAAHR